MLLVVPVGAAEPDFRKDGLPFLQKHCLTCHGMTKPKGDVSLHKYVDDFSVLKDRKAWPDILEQVHSGAMPPKDKPRPTPAEIDAFTKSVNGIFEKADKNAKPDPGRVTVRRLNKVEYNNTIRDLLEVDLNASEDFPSDDVGHGFDNIGDVLTLSPVLMERYLSAAESIANRSIIVNPPKPPSRALSSMYLQPGATGTQKGRYRQIVGSGDKGRLNASFGLTMDGEHVLKVRVYGKPAGDEPVKVALFVDGEEKKTFDVKATEEKKAEIMTTQLYLKAGEHRGEIRLLNGDFKKGEDERALFVEYIVMEGPLDTRPPFQQKLVMDADKPKGEQIRTMLKTLATRAFRRPVTTQEVERLAKLVESADRWEAGMQLALQAILVSPKFLFRLETEGDASGAVTPLSDWQLASRLSYFLWSSMPDQELFDLAAKGELSKNLDAQVQRMLKDPRSRALVDNFVMQWLQLRNLRNLQPDAALFPNFNERLRASMLKETELFFLALMQEDRSILDVIDADFAFMNLSLSKHYGIADTKGNLTTTKKKVPGGKQFRENEFDRITLPPGMRGGLLTQASVLTVTSNPTRTSPVKRGRWVLEQLLGTPPPPPPPDVPELPADEKSVATGSLRKRLEIHRENPACANCHAKMDPLGFAFENYNAIGGFRTKDGEFDIDPAGTLPDGRSFKGPDELKQILKEKKDLFSRCLSEKMLTYAIGRGLEYYDKRAVDKIVANLAKGDYKFSVLVAEIVKSEPFRMRRGR